MLNPADPRTPTDERQREADPWPVLIALAVIGPLIVAVGLAFLFAAAG